MNIRICDPCYDLGDRIFAVARYVDKSGDTNDVCEACLKTVKELKLKWWTIK